MPRMVDNRSPEQQLSSLLTASGCVSLQDPKFARYLDSIDPLGYMRFHFSIPTLESMERQPPEEPAPSTSPEVIAKSQRIRQGKQSPDPETRKAAIREQKSREPSPSPLARSPSPRAAAGSRGKQQQHQGLSGAKARSGEDGYSSSGSSSSDDARSPRQVYGDLQRTTGVASGGPAGNGGDNATTATTKFDVPAHLQTSSHEMIVYLAGNSLGLQSKSSAMCIQEELSMWQDKAVTGWFQSHYKRPWSSYSDRLAPLIAGLVGAKDEKEVTTMGTLTANLHFLLCAFYRPTKERYKILYEHKAFPSDRYAFASQAEMHGYSKADALITVKPREGEYLLRNEDILEMIEREGDQVAVVFFSGVNFFTGQVFEMEKITAAAHKKGCLVGWDLAHGIGNIPVKMHDWDVDFAVWCTYKYLNSGPGGIAGLFVHEKHANRPRLSGWWGNNLETRFQMAEDFDPAPGAAGFQTSTPSIISLAALYGSLESFLLCGKEDLAQQETPPTTAIALKKLRKKSLIITAYLAVLLKSSKYYVHPGKIAAFEALIGDHWKNPHGKSFRPGFTIITPEKPEERGAQLSILLLPRGIGLLHPCHEALMQAGVYGDDREPDVIRFAPIPLYNTYRDCWQAAKTLDWALKQAALKVQGKRGRRGRSDVA